MGMAMYVRAALGSVLLLSPALRAAAQRPVAPVLHETVILAAGTSEPRVLRWSDGPRAVPTPRGASLERASRLGLGTRDAAQELLARPARAEWLAEARGRAPRDLEWPVADGRFGRGFGFTRRERPELRHNGVDIGAERGAEVRAVADGIVAYSDNGLRGFGNVVLILHPNGWVSLYAHLARATVQAGWRAVRGERIGLVGSTGLSRGPHLHFELRDGGRPRDPEPLFASVPGRSPTAPEARDPDDAPASAGAPRWDRALVQRAERGEVPAAVTALVSGRSFRDLLVPVRGDVRIERRRRSALVYGALGEAVRVGEDGLVIHVDEGGAHGGAVVILSKAGRVVTYSGLAIRDVTAGSVVERGEWLGVLAAPALTVAVHAGGTVVDAAALFSSPRAPE